MFRPTVRCYSALSKRTKRVQIQLLKDFPRFQLHAGEVTQVKPSLMRNFLHNNNGARYILQDSDIDQTLLAKSKISSQPVSSNIIKKREPKIQKSKKETKAEKPKESQSALNTEVTVDSVKIPGLEL